MSRPASLAAAREPRTLRDLAIDAAAASFVAFSDQLADRASPIASRCDTGGFEFLTDFMVAWLLLGEQLDRPGAEGDYVTFVTAMALVRDDVAAGARGLPGCAAFTRRALVDAHALRVPPFAVGPQTYERWRSAGVRPRADFLAEYAEDCADWRQVLRR